MLLDSIFVFQMMFKRSTVCAYLVGGYTVNRKILVAVFMILYYRLPGILAVIALVVYGLIVLAIFKLLGVTMTLSGIAGFILSIGMAVDANVLIFERLKEELRLGKTFGAAIDEGFNRAWPSIRDGNISTIITCVILIMFTTSLVKGFAITLLLGVIMSMISAIVITKTLLKLVLPRLKSTWWLGGNRVKVAGNEHLTG